MAIGRLDFGVLETGETASLFLLEYGPLRASFSDYGASIVSLRLPPVRGLGEEILLGLSSLAAYAGPHPYYGSTVGRVAGRIGGAAFSLGGRRYELAANDGRNHLHGGLRGFERRLWRAEAFEEGGEPRLRFERRSTDGEEGYPGNLDVLVEFGLSAAQELRIRYEAGSDAPTLVNLTNHAYFNLRGPEGGDVLGHELRLAASRYLEADAELLPTGSILPVEGGPFDLRRSRPLREGPPGGYDHYFILDREGPGLFEALELREGESGRSLRLSSSCPGIQLYTGNFLAGELGRHGRRYSRHAGLCLEAQAYPDAPNRPDFPSIELRPGDVYAEETRYRFEF